MRPAERIALRDTLAAVLRDAPSPITATEAGDLTRTWWATFDGCIGTTRAYDSLEAMAKSGQVEKIKDGRSVYWRWIGDPVELPPLSRGRAEVRQAQATAPPQSSKSRRRGGS